MNKIDIYFSDDSELGEYEAINKGYRLDVYIKINDNLFNVRVYTMIRLQQDFESEIESYGYYAVEPNLILVKDSSREEIISTVANVYEQKYFEEIKPLENFDIGNLKKVN